MARTENIEPAVLTLTFSGISAPPGGLSSNYIDLSQVASIVNRRFYRQGLNWAVAGFKVLGAGAGTIQVSKVQNTWVTSGAWEKTMRTWLKQQNDSIELMGGQSGIARYRDYKVFLDDLHVSQYIAAGNDLNLSNLIPAAYVTGEWEPSQVVVPNDGAPGTTTEYLLKFYGGSDANAKDMIGGYATSRSRPQSPDPSTPSMQTSWLNRLQDVGDNSDEIIVNATDKNDEVPYSHVAYPGAPGNYDAAELHDQSTISSTTIGGITRLKGGNFPCGLIKFNVVNSSQSESLDVTLQIDMVPGHHRGYLCEPMTEM